MHRNFFEIENVERKSVTVIRPFNPDKEFKQLANEIESGLVRQELRVEVEKNFNLLSKNFLRNFKRKFEIKINDIQRDEAVEQAYQEYLGKFSDFCNKIHFEFLEDELDELKMKVLNYLVDVKNLHLIGVSDIRDEVLLDL